MKAEVLNMNWWEHKSFLKTAMYTYTVTTHVEVMQTAFHYK